MMLRSLMTMMCGLAILGSTSCSLLKSTNDGSTPETAIVLDTIDFEIQSDWLVPEQPMTEMKWDMDHVELDLRFNWEEEEVIGTANLTMHPHFYNQDSIELDARGFEISKVELSVGDKTLPSHYAYDGNTVIIGSPESFNQADTIVITIDYIARPSELENKGGSAITSSQGLYFINPRGDLDDVPTQLWTQGETNYNSGWFPCIDEPNQKHSQEIFLTVSQDYHTVSNGRLVYSTINEDSTRTDYWKQDLPHSTYLAMIAVGEFAVVKDSWRDKDVWYYLDEEYEEHAELIFGNTPEMLEFYSEILGVDYPWDKYHQVVVKDFVSGAMENTSAVIHGDFVQQTERDKLDVNHEDVVAHELFHHWFGDLVTCKSWSHITMNEGFATYGEYLWWQHKYGDDEARLHLDNDLDAYLSEATTSPKHLIRHRYMHPDDVFDSHSYQKGGRVLHMLRNEIGDEAFFESLRAYLNLYAFKTVEMDAFRMVVEGVTGRDLKWFFDQWYLQKGHPEVSVRYEVDTASGDLVASLVQNQDSDAPYRFHTDIVWEMPSGELNHRRIWLDQMSKEIRMEQAGNAVWYAMDPTKSMLWEVEEEKPAFAWRAQAVSSQTGIDRAQALIKLDETSDMIDFEYLKSIIQKDSFWLVRSVAVELLTELEEVDKEQSVNLAQRVAHDDESSYVRASALLTLGMLEADAKQVFVDALEDPSYDVMSVAIDQLLVDDACAILPVIESFEEEEKERLYGTILKAHAQCGSMSSLPFFVKEGESARGIDLFLLNNQFVEFARTTADVSVYDALVTQLGSTALSERSWWMRLMAVRGLEEAKAFYEERLESDEISIEEGASLRNKVANISAVIEEASDEDMEEYGRFRQ